MKKCVLFTLAACGLVLCSGCWDSGPYPVVPVSGTLTYEGKPVAGMRMHFSPAEGRPSIAITDSEGKFRPLYRAGQYGVQKGKVLVALEQNDDGGELLGRGARPNKNTQELLKEFGHSGKPVEIQIDGATDDLTIELTASISNGS